MKHWITQGMQLIEILNGLKEQYRKDNYLNIYYDTVSSGKDAEETLAGCSRIVLKNYGKLFYKPEDSKFYYHGEIPGFEALDVVHLVFKKGIQSALPAFLEEQLITVCTEKSTKKLIYSQSVEKQLRRRL